MRKKICLDGRKVDLKQILACFTEIIPKLSWSIYEFDACLKRSSGFDVNEISDKALKNDFGYLITASNLSSLAKNIEQMLNLILIGRTEKQTFTRYEDTDTWKANYDVVIELVDCGDDWEVYSTNLNIISELEKKLGRYVRVD